VNEHGTEYHRVEHPHRFMVARGDGAGGA
jgi:hypothetical protein